MERDWMYFVLLGFGAVFVWMLFRSGGIGGTKTSLIACAIAAGITYAVLFDWISF